MASDPVTADQKIKATSDHPSNVDLKDLETPWLAKPPADCCLTGTLHTGEPRGTFTQIADVDTYVTHPPAEKANRHILLYYADVWGMFTNGLMVMDAFADAGT